MNHTVPPGAASTENLLDVAIVGAGFGGICAAIKLSLRGESFRVFEKAGGIGGTWWHNTYPGAACDIPSHLYCYSFAPNPHWSRKYATQPEIQAYIEHCVDRYQLREHIQLNAEVTRFEWDESHGLWHLLLPDGKLCRARHVIFASGGLHLPSYPDIPGREDFAGPAMHSATWNSDVDFRDQRVAVIGSAASAIQLIPELAPRVAQLDIYQRTPNYIAPRNDRAFTEREKKRFARWPWLLRWYRQWLFLRGEWLLFPVVRTRHRSRWRERLQALIKLHIRKSVSDARVREALIPDYPLGCKRILIADNFYATLERDNVSLHTQSIKRIEERGVVTADGQLREADIVVYATGFDLEGYLRHTEVIGPGGTKLSETWSEIPQAYKGGFVPGFPNFYFTTGPNTGVGTTSVVYMIEAQLDLILQAIDRAAGSDLIEVRASASERYNRELRQALQETVWAGNCQSWYKRADGEISTLYPHNARQYRREHRHLALEDFDVRPRGRAAPD